MHNLLFDPLITAVRNDGARDPLSLPGVLTSLSRSEIISFPALRPHQRHVWHAFLVQLAVIALQRSDRSGLPDAEEDWRACLKALTSDWSNEEPWSLIVADARQPAFMQPPVLDGTIDDWDFAITPDEIDAAVTSAKAHDLKPAVQYLSAQEEWVYALVSAQTQTHYSGKRWYGVARSAGGYSNRLFAGIISSSFSGRFKQDVNTLIRQAAASNEWGFNPVDGLGLTWARKSMLSPLTSQQLHPLFIEANRRLRLRADGDLIRVHYKASPQPLVLAKTFRDNVKGNLGDPWAPVQRLSHDTESEGVSAAKLTSASLDYKYICKLLDRGRTTLPICAVPGSTSGQESLQFVVAGIARDPRPGKGQSLGYHERRIPIPGRARGYFLSAGKQDELATAARARVDTLADVRGALRFALFILAQGGPEKRADKPTTEAYVKPWLDRFEADVDRTFFEELWPELEEGDGEVRARILLDWRIEKREKARDLLKEAWRILPLPSARRYRARTRAESAFRGVLRGKDSFKQIYAEEAERYAREEASSS